MLTAKNLINEQWLKERKSGIGGSDASIILGVNPWKSRLELWNDKISDNIKISESINLNFKWGKILEPIIIKEYEKTTGRFVKTGLEQIKSTQYPFMNANLDGIVTDEKKGKGILEAKTKGAYVKWDDDIPIYYMMQIQHYLAVTEFKYASFVVLDFGKKDLLWYDVERDEELIKKLIEEESKFWNLVVNKIPPEIESSKSCQEFLKNKYAIETIGKTIDLTENEKANINAYNLGCVKEDIKELNKKELEFKNILMSIMGDAEIGIGTDYKITWKSPKDKIVFDTDKFKEDHPEIYKRYSSLEPQTRRFSIKFND